MIEARGLTKRYGDTLAVDDLTFTAEPGVVTGFLGPNGAGKSTTMRMIVGLDRPTGGEVTVNGRRYRDSPAPLTEVGALLEARSVHTGRSARAHLLAMAQTHGIGQKRVDEMLELVGLTEVARKRVGQFSLGMGQRLGIAAALLGDPAVLCLDEPVNGLDPEGIRWVRQLLKNLAGEGRTVFVSSHLMSEMALTATELVVVGRGRLIRQTSVEAFTGEASTGRVLVRTPDAARLADVLERPGAGSADVTPVTVVRQDERTLDVSGLTGADVGAAALAAGVVLHELTPMQASLEEAFMSLTAESVQYTGHTTGAARGPDEAPEEPGAVRAGAPAGGAR